MISQQKDKNSQNFLNKTFTFLNKNPVVGKTNCKYCEGLLLNIMLNKRYKNFHSAKSLISSNHRFNTFFDAHINSSF